MNSINQLIHFLWCHVLKNNCYSCCHLLAKERTIFSCSHLLAKERTNFFSWEVMTSHIYKHMHKYLYNCSYIHKYIYINIYMWGNCWSILSFLELLMDQSCWHPKSVEKSQKIQRRWGESQIPENITRIFCMVFTSESPFW